MARPRPTTLLVSAITSTALLGAFQVATVQADDDDDDRKRSFRVRLDPFQEVPSVSSAAKGEFRLRISRDGTSMDYELSYSGIATAVQQAHIHLGQRHTNGNISVFLCTNLGNGPAGTQACPASPAKISGTIDAASVVGPSAQGIAAAELAEVIKAIRAGATYANVHSAMFPGGELRAQIK
jgi:hypothetical protein